MGECHRHAPGTKPDPAHLRDGVPPIYFAALFPPTRVGDWCGDFYGTADSGLPVIIADLDESKDLEEG